MTERDKQIAYLRKLITDLPKADCEDCDMSDEYCLTCCYDDRLAEHLIDHGVIVPPVNVGDTVFIIDEYRNEEKQVCETKVFCIEKYADRLTTQLFPGRMAICVDDPWDSHAFVRRNTDEVYLTKEEAEAALEARENNG